MEKEDLFNMTKNEYNGCQVANCEAIWIDCVSNDTVCSTHHAEYDTCRKYDSHPSCVECELSWEITSMAHYDVFRNDHCGICWRHCAERLHHREYSPTFNDYFECTFGCGDMWYE